MVTIDFAVLKYGLDLVKRARRELGITMYDSEWPQALLARCQKLSEQ